MNGKQEINKVCNELFNNSKAMEKQYVLMPTKGLYLIKVGSQDNHIAWIKISKTSWKLKAKKKIGKSIFVKGL